MSNTSIHLSLPYIQGGQAQKHVTHNEAIRALDQIVQLSVVDQLTQPSGGEIEGDRVIVAPGGTAEFAGQDTSIAIYEGGAWVFVTSLIVFGILKAVMGIRVSEEEEYEGVDLSECGMEAYPEFTMK